MCFGNMNRLKKKKKTICKFYHLVFMKTRFVLVEMLKMVVVEVALVFDGVMALRTNHAVK